MPKGTNGHHHETVCSAQEPVARSKIKVTLHKENVKDLPKAAFSELNFYSLININSD